MTKKSRILAVISICLFFCATAWSVQDVSLAWDASPDHAVAGYKIHYGTASHLYASQIDVGMNTVVTLSGLRDGQTYYFGVCSYDQTGLEGTPSNEASFIASGSIVAPPPTSMHSVVVSPASGPVGTPVCLYGTNLGTAGSVKFNGVNASFTVSANTLLIATVPPGAGSGPLTITTTAETISSQFTVIPGIAPANDNFVNAQVLTGPAAFAFTDTASATKEPGEPNHAGNVGGASVWYRWTAPFSGTFTLDTAGSDFNTLLAVYTGNDVPTLSLLAGGSGSVTFIATAGVTYQIAADGYYGARGNLVLRLSPVLSPAIIFSDIFEAAGGWLSNLKLTGQNGWLGSVPNLTGLTSSFPGYGQQGYLGFSALSLLNNTTLLYHPLNFTLDTNSRPIIQFSVLLQISNPLNLFHDRFGWVFRNAGGQELFGVSFDNANGFVSYNLDDGAGQRNTGYRFNPYGPSALNITADFARNRWSATLDGTQVVTEQPITTLNAALTLGDVAAKAVYPGLTSGADGMVFDNFFVIAQPGPLPHIVLPPRSQLAAPGSDVTLGVIATGSPSVSCQRYFNGSPIAGATNASLSLNNVVSAQSGYYTVMVSNGNGSASAAAAVAIPDVLPRGLLARPASLGSRGQLLSFNLVNGHNYRLQTSTNLAAWSTLASFYANSSNAVFLDPAATNFPNRFYRLVSP